MRSIIALSICVTLLFCTRSTNSQTTNVTIEDYDYSEEDEEPAATLDARLDQLEFDLGVKLTQFAMSQVQGGGGDGGDEGTSFELSSDCMSIGLKLGFAVMGLKTWAIKVLDATAKSFDGILSASLIQLGDYDECLEVDEDTNESAGQYCLTEAKLPDVLIQAIIEHQEANNKSDTCLSRRKTIFRELKNVMISPEEIRYTMAVCLPAACDNNDVKQMIGAAHGKFGLPLTVKRCFSNGIRPLKDYEKILIAIFAFFLFMTTIGTIIHIYYKTFASNNLSLNNSKPRRFQKIFESTSAQRVMANLFQDKYTTLSNDIMPGLISFELCCIILAHCVILPIKIHPFSWKSLANLAKFLKDVTFTPLANAVIISETVFFIAGYMFVHARWKDADPQPVGGYISRFLLKTYVRFVLLQALTLGLLFLLPVIGSGPLWYDFVEEPLNICRENWWKNFLLIQNFWLQDDTCLPHTWILALLMQLYVISAAVLLLLDWWPKLGLVSCLLLTIISSIIIGLVTVVAEFPPVLSMYFYDYKVIQFLWQYMFAQSYNHLGPFCVGILTAYVCTKCSRAKIPKYAVILGWMASVTTILATLYSLFIYNDGSEMPRAFAAIYAAVYGVSWALGLSWITYACSTGYGGYVTDILSNNVFVKMERLGYLAFMVHLPVMLFICGQQRSTMHLTIIVVTMNFLAYTVLSYIVAFICYVIFQGPYLSLENFIEERCCCSAPRQISPTPTNEEDDNSKSIQVLFSKAHLDFEMTDK